MADPIVLVHGIFGFGALPIGNSVAAYFRGIRDALSKDGYCVPEPPQLDLAGNVVKRAGDLKRYLEDSTNAQIAGKRVHIIAHSMGGLDARYMISRLSMADRVASLTTIGTPHHGSPIADLVIDRTDPRVIAFVEYLKVKGIGDLTTAACEERNLDCADCDNVDYLSVAGRFDPPRVLGVPGGILGLTHDLVHKKEGDNDGLVSVQSAKFGSDATRWKYLGEWEADHFRLINWGTDIVLTPLELLDNSIVDKYRAIAALVVKRSGM